MSLTSQYLALCEQLNSNMLYCPRCQKDVEFNSISKSRITGAYTLDLEGPIEPTIIRTKSEIVNVCKVCGGSNLYESKQSYLGKVTQEKHEESNATRLAFIVVVLSVVTGLGILIWKRIDENNTTAVLDALINKVAQPSTREIPISKKELDILLSTAADVSMYKDRNAIYKALLLAKSSDNTDIDAAIAQFVTTRSMLPDVKKILIGEVLRLRNNPAIVPTLLTFAGTTSDTNAAANSLKAIRTMAEDRHLKPLLKIVQATSDLEVRRAAEETMAEIIRKSPTKIVETDKSGESKIYDAKYGVKTGSAKAITETK